MVGLEVELVEGGEELGDGADTLVSHVDTVSQAQADQARMEAGPETLLGDLVTAVDLQRVERLEELHESLQASVREVTAPQAEGVDVLGPVGTVLNEVKHVAVVGI